MTSIEGKAAGETLAGTDGVDRIDGGPGDDMATGGGDNDRLFGEGGDDTLDGGAGADVLDGGAGDDIVRGGEGDDILVSDSTGHDSLHGEAGNDQISIARFWAATPSHVVASGGSGNDRFSIQIREGHTIAVDAGEGDDYIRFSEVYTIASLTLGSGRDLVDIGAFDYYAARGGRIAIADFAAGAQGDSVYVETLLDRLSGWNSSLNPFTSGHFRLVQAGGDVVFSVSLAANGTWLSMVTFKNSSLAAFTAENFVGYAPNGVGAGSSVTGNDSAEQIFGGAAADVIDGLGGDDRIYAGTGTDSLNGGLGNDYLDGGLGDDLLEGGAGDDVLSGGDGDDQIHGGTGNDHLNSGRTGTDQMFGEDGDDTLALSRTSTAAASAIAASGGAGNDLVTISLGNAGTALVDSGDGHDRIAINALQGSATLTLGSGLDVVDFASFSTSGGGAITITDFQAGPGGDRIELQAYFVRALTGWDGSANPFSAGFARLLQDGSDLRLQIDRNGGSDGFATLLTFQGVTAASLSGFNLGGFGPDGAAAASLALSGSEEADWLVGDEGDDKIGSFGGDDRLFGHGGADDLDGGGGDDRIDGGSGDDLLEGGEGQDQIVGGAGNDRLSGGVGNDLLTENGSGGDVLSGGDGDDTIRITRGSGADQIAVSGGGDDDFLSISTNPTTVVTADMGEGADRVELRGTGPVTLTLGAGRDMVDLNNFGTSSTVAITDFEAGAAGDRLDFDHLFADGFAVADGSANPFATGFLRLVRSGADVVLQKDMDGASTTYAFANWLTLKNVDIWSLTASNFDGYALPVAAGTNSDELFTGTTQDDLFKGNGGNDTFLIGYGGNDVAIGDSGDDLFYVATGVYGPVRPSVSIDGGGGGDVLQIQTKLSMDYLPLILRTGGVPLPGGSSIEATGISTIELLSGYDSSRGWAANYAMTYYLAIEDGFAPSGAPLVIDTTRLAADEDFYIEGGGIQDSDAFIKLIGGVGVDHIHAGQGGSWLEGGGGDDEFYTGVGDDSIFGGDGDDYLFEDVGYSRSGTDHIDAGEGADVLSLVAGDQARWTSVTMKGGGGNDYMRLDVQGGIEPGVADIDLGTGSDRLKIEAAFGTFNVTLGAGSDILEISTGNFGGIGRIGGPGKTVSIADFDPGTGGDTLIWGFALNSYLSGGYSAFQNPFRTGHVRLLQDGGDVLVQISRLADGNHITLLRLQNHVVADFDGGLGGFATVASNGTADGETLTGTALGDVAYGLDGDDLFRFEQGGVDYLEGGEGDDVFYFGNGFTGDDSIAGGGGSDELVLQGGGGGIGVSGTLAGITGIEAITLLAVADPRFGPVSPNVIGFRLVTVDGNVAAGGMLTVDGSGLAAAQGVVFNGSAEQDGRFSIVGGAGADTITGGRGDDLIDGGTGADAMAGGLGNDLYFADNAGDTVQEAAGAGTDEVRTGLSSFTLAASNVETLRGLSDGGQALTGGSAGLTVIGAAGGDTLDDGGGAAILKGGLGDDFYAVRASATTVTEAAGEGSDTVRAYIARYTLGANLENLAGMLSTGQTLTGNGGGNRVSGGAGNDVLDGGAGNDVLDGGGGNDSLLYRADPLAPGTDVVVGGSGLDTLDLSFSELTAPAALSYSFTPDGAGGYHGWFASGPDHRVEFTGIERFAIDGTAVADEIYGADGNDSIIGFLGNDSVHGQGGDDFLVGEFGTDTLYGGAGDDRYVIDSQGSASAQHVVVELEGEGNDSVYTNYSQYTLTANVERIVGREDGGQALTGNSLDNFIMSWDGNDILDGGAGADDMNGGGGNDIYYVDNVGDLVGDGAGTDEIRTTLAAYAIGATLAVETLTGLLNSGQSLTGNSIINTIRGGGGDDILSGAGAADILWGGSGNDQLDGGTGNDSMRGELGDDVYIVDSSNDVVTENIAEGTDTVRTSFLNYVLGANLENLTGIAAHGQHLWGNALDNVVAGGGFGDTLYLLDGGADKALGNGGNDVLYFGKTMTAGDEADGGAGSDTLVLQGNYSAGLTFAANVIGIETLQLLARTDFRFGGSGATANIYNLVTVDSNVAAAAILIVDASLLLSDERLVFNASAEKDGRFTITGGGGNDTVAGGDGNDSISGAGGSDTLDGGLGIDIMTGGAGNDVFIVDNAADVVQEDLGGGTDEVRTGVAAYTLAAANVESLRGTSAAGQTLTAGRDGQTIVGASGSDLLDDAGFMVNLTAGPGDDVYAVRNGGFPGTVITEAAGEGTDTVRSYQVIYRLGSNLENLEGMLATGQTLEGNGLDNRIIGGNGNDQLDGGFAGADILMGGLGNDSYVFNGDFDQVIEAAGGGSDTIVTGLAAYTLGFDHVENIRGTSASGQALTGNGVANVLTGGAGNDVLVGHGGDDQLFGGDGVDTISYAAAAAGIVAVLGNLNQGTVTVGVGETDIVDRIEAIVGTDFADSFTHDGDAGSSMTLTGGAGDDVYRIGNWSDLVVELADGGTDHVFTSAFSYALGANLENLTGTSATAQSLFGNALDNVVTGGSAGDTLRLEAGGSDRAVGGAGNDILVFGASFGPGDRADGGSGIDVLRLQGSYAGLSLAAHVSGIETLELFGGGAAAPSNYQIVSHGLSTTDGPFKVDATRLKSGETLSFDASSETGAAFDLLGGAGADVLKGGALADSLDGGAGADLLAGGGGDDVYRVDNPGDSVVEQADGGADRVFTTLAAYTLGASLEGLLGLLDTGQALTGNASGNSIIGGGGNDVLDGGGGDLDYIEGHGGDDRFLIKLLGNVAAHGGSGADTLVIDYSNSATFVASFFETSADGLRGGVRDAFGGNTVSFSGVERFDIVTGIHDDDIKTGDGDDRLVLGAGDDRAESGGGNDHVEGGSGSDTLLGAAGDDRLDGGAGADSMYGGAGNDVYVVDLADQIAENEGEGVDEVRTSALSHVLGSNFEKLTATGYGQAPLSLRGNGLDNVVATEVGAAVILLQDGGADVAYGATNNDTFYFGAAFGAGDRVDGGMGSDTVVLQGAYGPLTLASGTMDAIQTLVLLSAGDDRFGGAAAHAYSYEIIVPDGFSSAMPGGWPFIEEEGELLIDASGLAAGESLVFDGRSADPALAKLSVKSGAGADRLLGSAGVDSLMGGGGDDLIEGGAGGDMLHDSGGGSNILLGGEGDDLLIFDGTQSGSTVAIDGGEGDDWAFLRAPGADTATIDMGTGNDRVTIDDLAGGSARVTLGSGQDILALNRSPLSVFGNNPGALVIADFQTGAGGDRVEWPADLALAFVGWTAGTNPFAAGYARLVQSGPDTILQVSPRANGEFATLVRFENQALSDFTGDNFSGWSPLPVTGGSGSDQLNGTASADFLFGDGGNDFFYLQAGGEDIANGGTGNDVLYFGAALSGGDVANGGDGRDAIVLQGNVTAILSDSNLVGIESISIQSGANTFFGDTAGNLYDYSVTTADGNVAPGEQLIVNAQSLKAGEDFSFDGSAEKDGRFLVYGGHGVDTLKGGDGVDVFFFEGQRWGATDKVDGGGGRDSVVISAGSGVTHIEFAGDALTGIESISVNNHFATDPSQRPSYELVLANGNVAPGGTLIVNGSSIAGADQFVDVDGSAVHDGKLILFSGTGDDELIGGGGADLLFAAGGADDLAGGDGADTFRYDSASDSTSGSTDEILDFLSGTDRIDLSRIDADSLAAGNQPFHWIGFNAFTGGGGAAAGELRIFQSAGRWFVEGDTDGNGIADLVISVATQGGGPLGQGDFLF